MILIGRGLDLSQRVCVGTPKKASGREKFLREKKQSLGQTKRNLKPVRF